MANRCAFLMVVLGLCLPLPAAAAGQAVAGPETVLTSWEPDVLAYLDQHMRK